MAAGGLAAGIGVAAGQPGLEPLIPRAEEAGFDALCQRSLYPINHLIVVRDDLLDAHPDLAADVFAAYATAKERRRFGPAAYRSPLCSTARLYGRRGTRGLTHGKPRYRGRGILHNGARGASGGP